MGPEMESVGCAVLTFDVVPSHTTYMWNGGSNPWRYHEHMIGQDCVVLW